MMCVLYINTQPFEREQMAQPHFLWELCLKLNDFKIRTPSLESRAIHLIKNARAFNRSFTCKTDPKS